MTKKKQQIKSLKEYESFVNEIKNKIHNARIKAVSSVNRELIDLHWEIGVRNRIVPGTSCHKKSGKCLRINPGISELYRD